MPLIRPFWCDSAWAVGEDVRDSPLYSACLHGHVQVVRYLNEVAKVDITRANAVTGTTPLYFACSFGKLRVVQYLVGTGKIDVHAARCRGRTLLHALCESPPDVDHFPESGRLEVAGPSPRPRMPSRCRKPK